MKLCVKNVAFSVKIDINREKYGFLQTVICRIKKNIVILCRLYKKTP